MTAIFFGGTWLASTGPGSELGKMVGTAFQKTVIWALALLVSLPFLIAAYRKIRALSMILAELSISERTDPRLTYQIRKIISEIIPVISIVIIMVLIAVLSAGILPSLELLMVVLVCAGILAFFVWPWFIKIHSKLQISFMQSMEGRDDKTP